MAVLSRQPARPYLYSACDERLEFSAVLEQNFLASVSYNWMLEKNCIGSGITARRNIVLRKTLPILLGRLGRAYFFSTNEPCITPYSTLSSLDTELLHKTVEKAQLDGRSKIKLYDLLQKFFLCVYFQIGQNVLRHTIFVVQDVLIKQKSCSVWHHYSLS